MFHFMFSYKTGGKEVGSNSNKFSKFETNLSVEESDLNLKYYLPVYKQEVCVMLTVSRGNVATSREKCPHLLGHKPISCYLLDQGFVSCSFQCGLHQI